MGHILDSVDSSLTGVGEIGKMQNMGKHDVQISCHSLVGQSVTRVELLDTVTLCQRPSLFILGPTWND